MCSLIVSCVWLQGPTIAPAANLVILHDIFDTFESSQILLKPVMRATGQQALVFNYPGQAFTKFTEPTTLSTSTPTTSTTAPNNEDMSDVVLELLSKVSESGEFLVGPGNPFHIVGFGFGGNIALSFVSRHLQTHFSGLCSGVTLVNSFAHVDSQLAAILHSSVNVFSCFPATKPDLPLSYFSRFLFSEAFLTKVQ